MSNRMAELAREAGIVGAGGAGFPTHLKLNATVEEIIINGAECEPLMTVDQYLMWEFSDSLVQEAEKLRQELQAGRVTFAIKEKHKEILQMLEAAAENYTSIRVFPLGDFYPAGDEVVLVYEVTGRSIPEGGIPLNAGVVVTNVETLWNLQQAENGIPNTDKWVTVSGMVEHPGVYRVPLGLPKRVLLKAAGAQTQHTALIDGGPMMGKLVDDWDSPVTKTTKGLLVLPEDNPVIRNRRADIKVSLRQAQSLCCQCRMCTDICPRNLLGYRCEPNRTILNASYQWRLQDEKGTGIAQAIACSQCGACDMYACPMGLSPRNVNGMLKELLGKNGVSDPAKGLVPTPSSWRRYRRIPTARLRKKLDVDRYESPVRHIGKMIEAKEITLLLRQHIGAPAKPVVEENQKVSRGQLVADIPENTEVSSRIFSGIDGTVTQITADSIKIRRD